MVVGERVLVRGRKRKGLEDRGVGRGLPFQENSAEIKLVSIVLLKWPCPDLRPILSLARVPPAGRGKKAET